MYKGAPLVAYLFFFFSSSAWGVPGFVLSNALAVPYFCTK